MADGQEMIIDGPAGVLAGTLIGTEGVQAALILPGSGPTDRNGNQVAQGLLTDSYRLLAEALAEGGLPTLRIDKRGIGSSEGDPNAVSLAAYGADTEAWIDALRRETGADCVWLIGHSEGGLIALSSAGLPDLCGLVLLTAPSRPIGPIIVEQLAQNPLYAPHAEAVGRLFEQLVAGQPLEFGTLPIELAMLFREETRDYLGELAATDPADLAAAAALPILAITGDADIQIAADAADRLVAANPEIEALILTGMTHTLKQVAPRDVSGSLQTYSNASLPLHPDLATAILDFVAAQ